MHAAVSGHRGQSRMSSSITLPLRTFRKGPSLFSLAGWPGSSGDLSASVLQCLVTGTQPQLAFYMTVWDSNSGP